MDMNIITEYVAENIPLSFQIVIGVVAGLINVYWFWHDGTYANFVIKIDKFIEKRKEIKI